MTIYPVGTSCPKGVSRVDSAARRMHGFYAYLTIDTRHVRTYFSDRRYGSSEAALAAASAAVMACRDEHDTYLRLKRRHRRRANSPGEIPGVSRSPAQSNELTGQWIARWHDHAGRRRSRRFSVRKYGEVAAYELALQARLEATIDERDRLRAVAGQMTVIKIQHAAIGAVEPSAPRQLAVDVKSTIA